MGSKAFATLLAVTYATMSCGGLSPSGGRPKNLHEVPSTIAQADAGTASGVPGDADACPIPAANAAYAAVEPLLRTKCTACHGPQSPSLATQADATVNRAAAAAAVTAGSMPPSGALAAEEIALFAAWNDAAAALALSAASPTYYDDIKPLIDAKCAWCHSATAKANVRERPYLTDYDQVKTNAAKVASEIRDGKMPPRLATPRLATGDATLFNTWQTTLMPAGMPKPPIDVTQPVFYAPTIKDLLAARCVTCHGSGGTSPDLSTYEGAALAGALAAADIVSGKMPPSAPLPVDEQDAFSKWVDDGRPFDVTGSIPTPTTPASALPRCP